ncbi:hypothetical protein K4A83_16835 [Spirulina subsalsa FACHB-351]|uniref:O-methyltransferase n=1 Tax=Spirulina subsalsa FACHB-351 TaxID=234711 RepID=A0ABT3L8T6_9CYAN|nr:hypothetical protein [Spirulina subsalsa]MCW6037927.1 hypothetical protein [Spirulina subsalsa FACHB-351]
MIKARKSYLLDKFSLIQPIVKSVPGYLEDEEAEYLFNKVQTLPSDAILLEIGSFYGKSTTTLAYGCLSTVGHTGTHAWGESPSGLVGYVLPS